MIDSIIATVIAAILGAGIGIIFGGLMALAPPYRLRRRRHARRAAAASVRRRLQVHG